MHANYQLAEIVKILFENRADPNIIEGENDFTPIFFSVIQNNLEITKILLGAGANPITKIRRVIPSFIIVLFTNIYPSWI